MRILLVEDNLKLAGAVQKRLTEEGFVVVAVATGREADERADSDKFDAIILDIMLPDLDGTTVCRNLRKRGHATPILMLTVLSTTSDKVAGLEAGADDYLTKPFEMDELVARVRALLRRCTPGELASLSFQDIEMNLSKRIVTRAGKPVELTAREFALLEFFLHNAERVVTRSAIGASVWDMNFEDESNVIEVYMSRLRRKLGDNGENRLIHTVPGMGYILSADRTTA